MIPNGSLTGCGPGGSLRHSLRRPRDADDPDVKTNHTSCAHGGVEGLELAHPVNIKLTRGAKLHMSLSAMTANHNQRQHPQIIARVRRKKVIDNAGTKESFGLSRRPRLEFLLKQFARCRHALVLRRRRKCTRTFPENVMTETETGYHAH
ncbi:hypothetical protein [Paraburkholderia strydomiana]